ncbi:MAG: MFS transporter [Lachnospiraceae bacterium]
MKKMNQRYLMLVLSFLFWFSQSTYTPYQTTYLTSAGYSLSVVGTVLGCYGVTQLVLRFPIGLFADLKNKHRYIIMIGAVLTGVSALIRFMMPTAFGFLVANLCAGIACSAWISYMVFFSGLYKDHEMQKSTALIIACSNGGGMLAYIMGTLYYTRYGMPLMCVLSLIAAIFAVLLSFAIREQEDVPLVLTQDSESVMHKIGNSIRIACCHPRILIFSFAALVQQGILNTVTLNMTAQHAKEIGANSFDLGLLAVLYMGEAVIFAFLATSRWCIKKGARFFITLIFLLLVIYCILMPYTTTLLQINLLQICCALSQGILFTFATSEALKDIPTEVRGTAMGFHQAVFAIGITFVPMITGSCMQKYTMGIAYGMLAILCVAAILAVNLFYTYEHKIK